MLRLQIGLSLLFVACPASPPEFGDDKGGSPDTGSIDTADADTDTDIDTDTDTDSPPDTDTGGSTDYNFDDPGDVVPFVADDGSADLLLADESGDSNIGQQFYLIMLNAEESDQSYELRYILGSDAAERRRDQPKRRRVRGLSTVEEVKPTGVRPMVPRRETLEDGDIGMLVDIFRVRNEMDSEGWQPKDATLWALGDHIAIWVDNEVPIDWDYECDGLVDERDEYQAFGFDNCDLSTVADIFDLNIYPNTTTLFGEPSDINEDGRIDLFISPELNALPLTSSDEDVQATVLSSFAEPSVDLADYDIKTNAGSDEREVIYAYAPDPNGYYHSGVGVSIAEYTNYSLAAELARSLVALISYNQHILAPDPNGSTVEEDWLLDVFGTLAADRCGFGASFHSDAWDYLDLPYNYPLLAEGTKGSLEPGSKGAQYLFGVWLYEWAQSGTTDPLAFLAAAVGSTETSTDAIDDALASYANDTDLEFTDLVMMWQLSMLASGVTDGAGNPLVTSAEFVGYAAPETISSPPAARDNLYGANGYQRGIQLRGVNYAWTGGHTDLPSLEDDSDVVLEGPDVYHYNPAFRFDGWVHSDFAAQVVRLDGVPYEEAALQVQFEGDGFVAEVVRWGDPLEPDYAIENIYGATDVGSVALPRLPTDGSTIFGIGEITRSGTVSSVDADGDAATEEVMDTDRWVLDLSDRSVLDTVSLHIWLDRRFDEDGNSQPDNPWIAVVPRDYLPEPTVEGTLNAGHCPDGAAFAFPGSVLDYLYYQVFLSGDMGTEVSIDDPCGEIDENPTTCDSDFDRDGVLDLNEPTPTTLIDQVLVQQCTLNGNVMPADEDIYDTSWLDLDERDEDDVPTYYRAFNTGGYAGTDGEEAFANVSVQGGGVYTIVVGAGSDEGLYELSVRELR